MPELTDVIGQARAVTATASGNREAGTSEVFPDQGHNVDDPEETINNRRYAGQKLEGRFQDQAVEVRGVLR